MKDSTSGLVSVVVPVYNEGAGLETFHRSLVAVLDDCAADGYEIIYADDGSSDHTPEILRQWHKADSRIKLVRLSRNFGKESALTAGIAAATGQAIMMLDGDGQHPVKLIPDFIAAWRRGAQVVIGVRLADDQLGLLKKLSSTLFYGVFNRLSGQKVRTGSTDFRLIDRVVADAFLSLPENDRITRGLIDWLGFRRDYIEFRAQARQSGSPTYNWPKLVRLGLNSFVSLTPAPLYLFGILGAVITLGAGLLGLAVLIEQIILGDPWRWNFTGTAMLGILILFLVGILLIAQGILSLYIAHIQSQSRRRPLYIVDYQASAGVSHKH